MSGDNPVKYVENAICGMELKVHHGKPKPLRKQLKTKVVSKCSLDQKRSCREAGKKAHTDSADLHKEMSNHLMDSLNLKKN